MRSLPKSAKPFKTATALSERTGQHRHPLVAKASADRNVSRSQADSPNGDSPGCDGLHNYGCVDVRDRPDDRTRGDRHDGRAHGHAARTQSVKYLLTAERLRLKSAPPTPRPRQRTCLEQQGLELPFSTLLFPSFVQFPWISSSRITWLKWGPKELVSCSQKFDQDPQVCCPAPQPLRKCKRRTRS